MVSDVSDTGTGIPHPPPSCARRGAPSCACLPRKGGGDPTESSSRGRPAERLDLREYEPNPVRALVAGAELGEDGGIDWVLGGGEAEGGNTIEELLRNDLAFSVDATRYVTERGHSANLSNKNWFLAALHRY